MAEVVAPHMPSAAQVAACRWLPDAELAVYAGEFARTGFQGGLQWYRCGTSGLNARDLRLFAGRAIDHIGFEVKNLEAFTKKLAAQGTKLDEPIRSVPAAKNLKITFITDPWGTRIELTEGLDQY